MPFIPNNEDNDSFCLWAVADSRGGGGGGATGAPLPKIGSTMGFFYPIFFYQNA